MLQQEACMPVARKIYLSGSQKIVTKKLVANLQK